MKNTGPALPWGGVAYYAWGCLWAARSRNALKLQCSGQSCWPMCVISSPPQALQPGVRSYHMNFKRGKPNIFLSNQSRLIINLCAIMSTDQGKWFHFLVYLSLGFFVCLPPTHPIRCVVPFRVQHAEVPSKGPFGFVLKLRIKVHVIFRLQH